MPGRNQKLTEKDDMATDMGGMPGTVYCLGDSSLDRLGGKLGYEDRS